MWELDGNIIETPTERRVKKWSFCFEELLRDGAGLREFELFLEKEFSSENISFWLAVEDLKGMSKSKVESKAHEIYQEFLAKGAPKEINIDSKTMEITVNNLTKPSRLTFDAAQNHIFLLMKKDSYPRFIRSDHYKTLLALAYNPSKRKKFFLFGNKKRPPNNSPNMKRRGSTGRPKAPTAGGADFSAPTNHNAHLSLSAENLKFLDSDASDKEEHYKFEPPSSVKKQVDRKAGPAQNGRSGEKSQPSTSASKVTQPSSQPKNPTSDAAKPVTNSENVIAPWEEDSFDSIAGLS